MKQAMAVLAVILVGGVVLVAYGVLALSLMLCALGIVILVVSWLSHTTSSPPDLSPRVTAEPPMPNLSARRPTPRPAKRRARSRRDDAAAVDVVEDDLAAANGSDI